MGKIVVTMFVSLDGVMQAPGGADEDTAGGFAHGGWTRPYADEDFGAFKLDELQASDALLFGRKTYEVSAAAWPNYTDEVGYADKMNSMPKVVVSTTLKEGVWNNSTVINRDVAAEVAKLKRQFDKDILVYGSGELVQTLIQHDLVDEYRLLVYPLVLGSGKTLFRDDNFVTLTLVDSKAFSSGVLLLIYHPAR